MYLQAIEIVENEGKAAMAGDTYRSAISESCLTLHSLFPGCVCLKLRAAASP